MLNTILGQKTKMLQAFVENARVPVTVVKAGPCVVTQIKNLKRDGYWGVQLGFGEKKVKNITKPMRGHLKGAFEGKKAPSFLVEIRVDEKPEFKVGDKIELNQVLSEGDLVSVTGKSKGKGFAGVVKRWGFAGGPKTHGQSDRHRAPGSIGQGTDPGRVRKGKKMAGRMGQDRVTVKNLKVIKLDSERGEVYLSGSLPGSKMTPLIIKKISSGEGVPKKGEENAES